MLQLAYILSASHSGSNFLAMLAGSHPRIFTVGEMKAAGFGNPADDWCSCGARTKECPFWRNVTQDMARRGVSFDVTDVRTDFRNLGSRYVDWLLRPLVQRRSVERARDAALWLSPTWRAGRSEIRRRNVALLETIGRLTGARIIVDSSGIGLRLKYLLQIPELDIRVLRLIRDGRSVTLCRLYPAQYTGVADPKFRRGNRRKERLSVDEAAYEWRRSNEEAEHLLVRLDPSKWMEVRYEELCRFPKATMLEIFSFLDADPSEASWNFHATDHHVLGNGTRPDASREIVLDERWKSVLTENELSKFNTVAGELNARYGYR
jgi:hypothetical protein